MRALVSYNISGFYFKIAKRIKHNIYYYWGVGMTGLSKALWTGALQHAVLLEAEAGCIHVGLRASHVLGGLTLPGAWLLQVLSCPRCQAVPGAGLTQVLGCPGCWVSKACSPRLL